MVEQRETERDALADQHRHSAVPMSDDDQTRAPLPGKHLLEGTMADVVGSELGRLPVWHYMHKPNRAQTMRRCLHLVMVRCGSRGRVSLKPGVARRPSR